MIKPKLLLMPIIFGLIFSATQPAQAAGLTISPPLQRISIETDQQVHSSTIMVTNQQSTTAHINLSVYDFGDLEQGGGLAFLGTSGSTDWSQHQLANWLTVSPQTATLEPDQQLAIQVTITNNQDLSPGGHYAAIVANLQSDGTGQQIAVNQSLASLLFVNKIGGEVFGMDLADFTPHSTWWSASSGAQMELLNTGNTHLTPRGSLELKDPFGHPIAKQVINQKSSLLLPQQSQIFNAQFNQADPAWWPGAYTLVLSYRYDGTDQFIQQSQTIYSLGIITTAGLLVGLSAIVAFAIRRWSRQHTDM